MKNAMICFLTLSGAAFAQGSPDNAASDALKKRLMSMSLLTPPRPLLHVELKAAVRPRGCAAQLLPAPVATQDVMPLATPRLDVSVDSRAELKQLPAPPCS